MITKETFSSAAVWRPTEANEEKQVAGPCEVSAFKLSASGGAAACAIYDAADSSGAILANQKWFLDASTTDNDAQSFLSPIQFSRGVYVKFEQGGDFNPVFCMTRIR